MAARNAIILCEKLITACNTNSENIRKMTKDWNPDGLQGIGLSIAKSMDDVSDCVKKIKSEIEPNCKHPKKMQDIINGKRYCMNCNFDLDD